MRGIVTIVFSRPESAAKALESLNGVQVDKRPMKIEVVLDATKAVAAVPSKGLSDRITNNKGPKPATAAKATANGAGTRDNTRGRGRGGRRGRNAGRAKPKTADELDAEMTDYFDTNAANGAVQGNDGVATNGAVQPVANGADDLGMDEISLLSQASSHDSSGLLNNSTNMDSGSLHYIPTTALNFESCRLPSSFNHAIRSPSHGRRRASPHTQAPDHHTTNNDNDLSNCIFLQPIYRSWLHHDSELECSHDHKTPSRSSTTSSPKPPNEHEHALQLSDTNPSHVIVIKPSPASISSSSSDKQSSGKERQLAEASGHACSPDDEYHAFPLRTMLVAQD
ncbi:MAG: hypothetical protein L6R38_006608 [Xanthoria sp. 2 TBL-2021]|nr:MAG: hypothetical protein L6R38_006608 [Xanthoria sp. 2 TBL-2021]